MSDYARPGDGALSGIKILELCDFVAGPFCCKLLADLGADVVKIEDPAGDSSRKRGPFLDDIPGPERSGLFQYLNTCKLGVTLDVRNPGARAILERLVQSADVLVEDTAPGTMAELGLAYEVLREVNPRLVMVSVTPFGQTGPHRRYKAHSLNLFHSGGEGYFTPGGSQFLDQPPLMHGQYVAEYECGLTSAVMTSMALYWQQISGHGQYVDVSKQESLAVVNVHELDVYPNEDFLVSRATRGFRLAGIMPCKDGHVQVVLYTDGQWRGLVAMMGNPAWAQDVKYQDHVSRTKNAAELNPLIASWLMEHTKQELYAQALRFGVPLAPYYNIHEAATSEQMNSRQFFVEVDHPVVGKCAYPSAPYRFSETPVRLSAAPLLGQDSELIYCGWLGYSRQDLVELREAGVI